MANPEPTAYLDTTVTTGAVAVRELEVTTASFTDGGNWAGSCAPGIGINVGGGALTEDPNQWTLLDQAGAGRIPQDSSYIGNTGLGAGAAGVGTVPIRHNANSASGDGELAAVVVAALAVLATGWT